VKDLNPRLGVVAMSMKGNVKKQDSSAGNKSDMFMGFRKAHRGPDSILCQIT
jgi:hypothetical protein